MAILCSGSEVWADNLWGYEWGRQQRSELPTGFLWYSHAASFNCYVANVQLSVKNE